MKKIGLKFWIPTAAVILYTGSLWQRHLFMPEYNSAETARKLASSDLLALVLSANENFHLNIGDIFNAISVFIAGTNPFAVRFPGALFTLLAALLLWSCVRIFRQNEKSTAAVPLIFLTSPAVFIAGTSGAPAAICGACCTAALCTSIAAAEKKRWSWWFAPLLPLLMASTFDLSAILTFFTLTLMLMLLSSLREWKRIIPLFIPLALTAGLHLLLYKPLSVPFRILTAAEYKWVAAAAVAGFFPWLCFIPAAFRNFFSRVPALLEERGSRLALCWLGGALLSAFLTGSTAAALTVPAAMAWLLTAALEKEIEENGCRSINITAGILSGIFLLTALAVTLYGILSVHVKLASLPKIWMSSDSWPLTAIVPAVSAVWLWTAIREGADRHLKIIFCSAGLAFFLFALHSLVPARMSANCSAKMFFRTAVQPKLEKNMMIFADDAMYAPSCWELRRNDIRQYSGQDSIKEMLQKKSSFCVLTSSAASAAALPFPKITLRSGRFFAVFYNTPFPEMRINRPK